MKQTQQHWTRVLPSLLIPIFVGLSLYLAVMTLLETGQISNDVVSRYLTGHPVSRITTAMFCVGLASLGLLAWDVLRQSLSMQRIARTLDSKSADSLEEESATENGAVAQDMVEDAAATTNDQMTNGQQSAALLGRLKERCAHLEHHYLYQRLARLFLFLSRGDDSVSWDDEAKYLSDLDQEKMSHRYSLVRILIWATPMLGFLGTVLGISQALGGIQVGPDNDFQQMMDGLRSSLYVAFDTTALALTLSMVLMFFQFLVERFESQLLTSVDEQTVVIMASRFGRSSSSSHDNTLRQIQRTVVANNHQLIQNQAELWRETIRTAQEAWKSSLIESNQAVQEGLRAAVIHAVRELQQQLGRNIDRADSALAHRWEQWQVLLSENARKFSLNQSEMIRQTEVLADAIQSLREIQERLNSRHQPEKTLRATERLQETLDRLVKTIEWMGRQAASQSTRDDANKSGSIHPLHPSAESGRLKARDAYFNDRTQTAPRQKKAG